MKMPNVFDGSVPGESFAAGSTIFAEGDPGLLMYIIKEGEVELHVHGKVVDTLGPEEFFGEMALIEGSTRSATAVAKTDCKLEPINEKQFLFMVQETPFFSLRIMKTMSSRLRRIDRLI